MSRRIAAKHRQQHAAILMKWDHRCVFIEYFTIALNTAQPITISLSLLSRYLKILQKQKHMVGKDMKENNDLIFTFGFTIHAARQTSFGNISANNLIGNTSI